MVILIWSGSSSAVILWPYRVRVPDFRALYRTHMILTSVILARALSLTLTWVYASRKVVL